MEAISGSLHWLVAIVILGAGISFAHKWLPAIFLAKLGSLPFFSANWITSWSIVLWYPGFVLYLNGYFLQGLLLMVVAGAYDKLDGHVARAKKICGFPRSVASVQIGKWWDPLADKIRQLPVIAYMMAAGVFSPYIALPVILIDVAGTFVREPFTNAPFNKYRVFQLIKNNLRQTEASRVGKAKSLFQILALIAAMPYHQGWLSPGVLPDIVLGIALPLGILSVITRIKIHRDVDKVVDDVHSVFVAEEQS